jgi:mycofactocin system glycosyltransferase
MKIPHSYSSPYRSPDPGTYRLAKGVRVVSKNDGTFAISDYPLKAVHLSAAAAQVLQCCREQRTCAELADETGLSLKRVRSICEQLRWKGLLEAGPLLLPGTWPKVSILIPSYNRAAALKRCLQSLEALNYPADCLEIVVIDDASSDKTEAMLSEYIQQAGAKGRQVRSVRHAQRKGVALSRNTGAEAARYDLLAYIDSDCVASPEWLNDLVPAFQDIHIAAVGGTIRALDRIALLGRYEDVRSSLFMGMRAQQVRLEEPLSYLPTANLLVRRAAWRQISGFAALTWGEDVDFCRRLLAANQHILYLPCGVVYHDYRTAWWPFLCTRAAYASSEAALLKRHPEQRRVLLLPPEQAIFAVNTVGGLWINMHGRASARLDPFHSGAINGGQDGQAQGPHVPTSTSPCPYYMRRFAVLVPIILTLLGAFRRWRRVREQEMPIGPLAVLQATLRGNLAYTYHLCRHMTRYYTLPLLLIGLILPPLLLLAIILCGIVIGVDYVRLRPDMGPGAYALCSILDDCAYELGVVIGCLRHGTWKPLWPLLKRSPVARRGA